MSKLAKIKAAVAEYSKLQADNSVSWRQVEIERINLRSRIMASIPELLAIAEAAILFDKALDNQFDRLDEVRERKILQNALAKLERE